MSMIGSIFSFVGSAVILVGMVITAANWGDASLWFFRGLAMMFAGASVLLLVAQHPIASIFTAVVSAGALAIGAISNMPVGTEV